MELKLSTRVQQTTYSKEETHEQRGLNKCAQNWRKRTCLVPGTNEIAKESIMLIVTRDNSIQ